MLNTFIASKVFSEDFHMGRDGLKEDFIPHPKTPLTTFESFEKYKFSDPAPKREDPFAFSRSELARQQDLISADLEAFRDQFEQKSIYYFLPRTGGRWEDKPGNSEWYPYRSEVPKKNNPEGKTWGEILDEYGIEGIEFDGDEPDFSPVAEATVEIDDFSNQRLGEEGNYKKADQKLADQWNKEGKDGRTDWTAQDVEAYRKENNLTWHERSDMKTMDLVPTIIHANVPHAGGISEANKQKSESSS